MFRRLLVPLDGSPLAERALPVAASIARASRATLDLVLVHDPLPLIGEERAAVERSAEDLYLASLAAKMGRTDTFPLTHGVLTGSSVEQICARALATDADLIVLTSHGRTGFNRLWLGSVADGVIRHSHVPVLMLRPAEEAPPHAEPPSFRHVLVTLDGSPFSAEIIQPASDLARAFGARVVLLQVVPPVPTYLGQGAAPWAYPVIDEEATQHLVVDAQQDLATVARRLAEEGLPDSESHVIVDARPAHALIRFAAGHEVDVIAMSTHGRGASRQLVGSVADKLLRGCGLPILVHRPAAVGARRPVLDERAIVQDLPALSGVGQDVGA